MKKFLCVLATVLTLPLCSHAEGLAGLQDAIDDIETQIDNIDLDQSKDAIQSDLDDIKAALEDLKGEETVYVNPRPAKPNYQLVPVNPAKRGPITKTVNGHKYVWTESDNPKIGWHWLQVN